MGISPYNVYPTQDGYVVINSPGDHHFRAILKTMGRDDLIGDERYATRTARVQHMYEVDAILEAWTSQHPKAAVAKAMLDAGVPCAPVRGLSEVMADENMHARGSLQWVEHPELGRVVLPHSPMRYEGSEMVPLQPSHTLGADGDAIYGDWLGRTPEELAELRAQKVI
jgi:formyl-CoA transferase